MAAETSRALKILAGVRAEGVSPVLATWSLIREVRILARAGEAALAREDLGTALQKLGVWRNRQGVVRAALARHPVGSSYRLLKMLGEADARSKGQAPGDPWQLLAGTVVCLAGSARRQAA